MVWGGGYLGSIGVIDFAGGLVVHVTCGVAALVSAIMIGPRQRATIYGFVVYDFDHMRDSFIRDASGWYEDGLLNYSEDLVYGIEKTPNHFIKLMKGENFGKTIVQFIDY